MEVCGDGPYRRLNLMLPRTDSAQVGERGYEADGSMPAHPKVADIVEEDDACRGLRIDGFTEECANDDLRSAWFTNDPTSEVIEFALKTLYAAGEIAGSEIRAPC